MRLVTAESPAAAPVLDLENLVDGLRSGDREARDQLVDHFGDHVRRVLFRVLGARDPDHADLVHEVFVQALASIDSLADPKAIKAWISSIAVFIARGCIRKRQRHRWFVRAAPPPVEAGPGVDDDAREAMRCVYRILDSLPADERIALTLRKIEGMDLAALAEICRVSVPTIRRRLARAEARFARLVDKHEVLAPWKEAP